MRVVTRFHAITFVAICSVIYIGWILPSLNVRTRMAKVWNGSQRRVVVFGDSWSDTGEYRVAVPKGNWKKNTSYPLWTEALCKEIVCDYVDNFARSPLAADGKGSQDAVVDVDVFANASNQHPDNPKFLADFKTQVQHWVNFEKQKGGMSGRSDDKEELTVFTVFFGISDIWQYAALEDKEAKWAVKESIAAIFQQLDVIVEQVKAPIHVVLPKVVDITFLPAFALQPVGAFPGQQRSAVFLTQEWNSELQNVAGSWTGGFVHLLELDKWILNLIREQQLYKIGIFDENGVGKSVPTFSDVRSPCLPLAQGGPQFPFDATANNTRTGTCEDASRYLFWDGMHLSARAHQLLGAEAAGLVSRNTTFNLRALRIHEEEEAAAKEKAAQEDQPEFHQNAS